MVELITTEGLLEMLANKQKFKLVEVLQEEGFRKGHILGAISLPLDGLQGLAMKCLRKTDTIAVYCLNYQCKASTNAARTPLGMGYRKTLNYKVGKKGWLHAGFELEK